MTRDPVIGEPVTGHTSRQERWYGALLHAYPRAWRRANGAEVLGLLLDDAAAAGRSRPRVTDSWDLLRQGLGERRRRPSLGERSGRPLGVRLLRAVLAPPLRLAYRPRVTGLEHFPATGPVLLASNHLSFCDSLFLPLVVPRQLYFLGKAEYVTGRGPLGRLRAAFFRATGMVPVDRRNGAAAVVALHQGRRVLEAGNVFGIYPEGTRSPDGRLYRGRTGVARLALMTGCPVVPCALVGTDRVQPRGRRIPRPGRVEIRFGRPLDFSDRSAQDWAALRAVTDTVMREVQALSGQEYVDRYAPSTAA